VTGVGLVLALWLAAPRPEARPTAAMAETLVSLDVKDAAIVDVVHLLGEIGGFQTVLDPGVACALTVNVKKMAWPAVLDTALGACRLGYEAANGVVRIAPVARLTEEATAKRQLDEERRLSGPLGVTRYRLSYAKAAELAPILKKFLSPRGEVIVDARTNTLIVTDVR
jgi:type II secretory pathway component HofQ